MKYTYTIREDKLPHGDAPAHTGYGIDIWLEGKLISTVPDIFLHFCQAARFVQLCNTLKLDPIHFMEAVEDAIS